MNIKKYKIFFENKNINPVEFSILKDDGGYFVNGAVKVKNENFFFNFKGSEKNIINAVKKELNKFGIHKIESTTG